MPERGTCGKVNAEAKSRSSPAGLQLPVGCFRRLLSALVYVGGFLSPSLPGRSDGVSCRRTLEIIIHGGSKNY